MFKLQSKAFIVCHATTKGPKSSHENVLYRIVPTPPACSWPVVQGRTTVRLDVGASWHDHRHKGWILIYLTWTLSSVYSWYGLDVPGAVVSIVDKAWLTAVHGWDVCCADLYLAVFIKLCVWQCLQYRNHCRSLHCNGTLTETLPSADFALPLKYLMSFFFWFILFS